MVQPVRGPAEREFARAATRASIGLSLPTPEGPATPMSTPALLPVPARGANRPPASAIPVISVPSLRHQSQPRRRKNQSGTAADSTIAAIASG